MRQGVRPRPLLAAALALAATGLLAAAPLRVDRNPTPAPGPLGLGGPTSVLPPALVPGRAPPRAPPPPSPAITREARIAARVDGLLAHMTLEEKVGQLLFVGFGGYQVDPGGAIAQLVGGHHVGGVALFSRNVRSLRQVAHLTRTLRTLPEIAPFIAVDQEGGNVVRLETPATVLPGNMTLGASRDPALARRAGADVGRSLERLGFNMNLAPVLDVNANPRNPVIGVRSFGEDPGLVAELGTQYILGLQSQGVVAVAKHFPGHGDTATDSHYGLPTVPYGLKRLMSVELVPFKAAIDAGLDAVMTAHIALPAIEGRPHVPATVSHKILTGILRRRLGFTGIVLTDGLEMEGIVKEYGSGVAAVKAIQAGADMVLILWTREKKEEVWRHLLAAVRSGAISRTRLDTSVRRILTVKVERGILDEAPPPVDAALAALERDHDGAKVAQAIANQGLTLVRAHAGLTPLDRDAHVVILSADRTFGRTLSHALQHAKLVHTPAIPTRRRRADDLARTLRLARHADVVVVGVVNDYQAVMTRMLLRRTRTPVVAVSLGSPYRLHEFPGVEGYLCAYSYQPSAARAAARFLAGDGPAPGRLPVTLPGFYDRGHAARLPGTGGSGGTTARAGLH